MTGFAGMMVLHRSGFALMGTANDLTEISVFQGGKVVCLSHEEELKQHKSRLKRRNTKHIRRLVGGCLKNLHTEFNQMDDKIRDKNKLSIDLTKLLFRPIPRRKSSCANGAFLKALPE